MKILILCIDRDDDLGRKTKLKGPIIGKKNVLNAAVTLATSDPTETDANAIFASIKLYNELSEEKEIAVLTGSPRVGYESDIKIKKQLKFVKKNFEADGVIIVGDGKEDELVAPIIESLIPVLSIHRITVSSGEELKGAYYTLTNFVKRSSEDLNLAKNLFGIPAIILLLYALFGTFSWRILAGVFSISLLLKWMLLNKKISKTWEYVKNSVLTLSLSFFLYLISGVLFVVAAVKTSYIPFTTTIEFFAHIAVKTAHLFFYGLLALLFGLAIDALSEKKKAFGFITAGVGLGVVMLVSRSLGSWILEPTYPLSYVITTTLLGLVIVTVVKLSSKLIK